MFKFFKKSKTKKKAESPPIPKKVKAKKEEPIKESRPKPETVKKEKILTAEGLKRMMIKGKK